MSHAYIHDKTDQGCIDILPVCFYIAVVEGSMPVAAMPLFDTLKYVEELLAAGVPEQQAKAHARAAARAHENSLDRLATKGDLLMMKDDLALVKNDVVSVRNELALTESRLTGRIDKLDATLHDHMTHTRWMFGVVIAGIAAILLRTYFPA